MAQPGAAAIEYGKMEAPNGSVRGGGAMFDDFYVLVGIGLLVGAVVWFISPRSRYKLRRLAIGAVLIGLLLAIAYNYSRDNEGVAAPATPASASDPGTR